MHLVFSSSQKYSSFKEWKIVFVGAIGLTTAVLSLLHNYLLYYTFVTSKVLLKRRITYIKWIALCDIFISISYIAIMCVQVGFFVCRFTTSSTRIYLFITFAYYLFIYLSIFLWRRISGWIGKGKMVVVMNTV